MKRLMIAAAMLALLLTAAPLALAGAGQGNKNSAKNSDKSSLRAADKAARQADKAAAKAARQADRAARQADKGTSHGQGANKFQLEGYVVSFDTGSQTLVVTVKSGAKTIKSFRGLPFPVIVAADARLVDGSAGGAAALVLSALTAGSKVHVGGVIDRTDPAALIYTATRVILQQAGPPSDTTDEPTAEPTVDPSVEPTVEPTVDPSVEPTVEPTVDPTTDPSLEPDPSESPVVIEGFFGHVVAELAARA